MPHQRTITIYEYIPVNELEGKLDDEERVMAEVINQHLSEIRRSDGYEETGLSWDEVLVLYSEAEDYDNLRDRAITAIESGHIQDSVKPMGLLQLCLVRPSKDRLREKFSDFLSRQDIHAASFGALTFWELWAIVKETVNLLKKNNEYESTNNQRNQELTKALLEGMIASSKGKHRDAFMCSVIKQVLERKGVDWLTFNPRSGAGGGEITHSELFELCKAESERLFPSPKNGENWMRSIMWPVFKKYRERKILKASNRMGFHTDH